jgi:hypothetical protein
MAGQAVAGSGVAQQIYQREVPSDGIGEAGKKIGETKPTLEQAIAQKKFDTMVDGYAADLRNPEMHNEAVAALYPQGHTLGLTRAEMDASIGRYPAQKKLEWPLGPTVPNGPGGLEPWLNQHGGFKNKSPAGGVSLRSSTGSGHSE